MRTVATVTQNVDTVWLELEFDLLILFGLQQRVVRCSLWVVQILSVSARSGCVTETSKEVRWASLATHMTFVGPQRKLQL